MKLTDKAIRKLMRDEGYFGTQDRLEDHAREHAVEVLRLRKIARAAEALVVPEMLADGRGNERFERLRAFFYREGERK